MPGSASMLQRADQNAIIGSHPQVKISISPTDFPATACSRVRRREMPLPNSSSMAPIAPLIWRAWATAAWPATSPCSEKTSSDATPRPQHVVASGLWTRGKFRLRSGPSGRRLCRIADSNHHSFQSSRPRQAFRRKIAARGTWGHPEITRWPWRPCISAWA